MHLRDYCPLVKQVWLTDDSAGGESIVQLYNWYKQLSKEGQKFEYFVNGSKSWLIVKSGKLAKEAKRVFGDEVNITPLDVKSLVPSCTITMSERNE